MTEYIDKSCAHIRCLTKKGPGGVVAIGVLPLVTRVTPKPLLLNNRTRPQFSCTSAHLNSMYGNFYSYEVGTVGRFSMNFLTSLNPTQLKEVFPHFLKFAYSEGFDIGVENRHLLVDTHGYLDDIVDRLTESGSQFIFSNCAVLATFGRWVRDCLHSRIPNAELFGAITIVGNDPVDLPTLRCPLTGVELEWLPQLPVEAAPEAEPPPLVEPLVSAPEVEQPPQVEPLPAPADPPVDQGTLRPRVPIHGRRRHRERFCRPRVVRNENLPDNPRRRPRKRTI